MIIRQTTEADTKTVNALAVRSWSQYQHHYPDWPKTRLSIGNMADLARTGTVFVLQTETSIAGAVAYMPPGTPRAEYFQNDWALIRMLVVDPASRGNGYGRLLTEKCISLAKESGVPTIALHTNEMMEAALSLYISLGFNRVATAPSPTAIPFGIYCMDLRDAL